MSGVKHTPGPWRTDYRKTVRGGYAQEIFDAAGELIATAAWYPVPLNDTTTTTNREANARLIAAAPCMFEYILSSAQNGCATAQEIVTRATGDRPEKGGAL